MKKLVVRHPDNNTALVFLCDAHLAIQKTTLQDAAEDADTRGRCMVCDNILPQDAIEALTRTEPAR